MPKNVNSMDCDTDRDPIASSPNATVEPLLVPAGVAGPMCGRSEASWWRDHAAGRIPAPVKLGGRTLWRVEELREWIAASCPLRQQWEAIQAAQRNGRTR